MLTNVPHILSPSYALQPTNQLVIWVQNESFLEEAKRELKEEYNCLILGEDNDPAIIVVSANSSDLKKLLLDKPHWLTDIQFSQRIHVC
jgi:hypothetical protein